MDEGRVREVAERHRAMLAAQRRDLGRPLARTVPTGPWNELSGPWRDLANEFCRYANAYNDELGRCRLDVEVWVDGIALQAGTESLTLELNRRTGQVRGSLSERDLDDLGMRLTTRNDQIIWVFQDMYPAEPDEIALVLATRLTDLSVAESSTAT